MKHQILLHTADRIASAIVAELQPACERIELAGSVRRRKSHVGDIEIVAIPHMEAGGLFGDESVSQLDGVLSDLCKCDPPRLHRIKGGDRMRQYQVMRQAPLCLDLWIVHPETWGVQFLIRTGPWDFSKAFVTKRSQGGLLPDNMMVDAGRIWVGRVKQDIDGKSQLVEEGEPIDTPEERDVFEAIGLPWMEPNQRSIAAAMDALKRKVTHGS